MGGAICGGIRQGLLAIQYASAQERFPHNVNVLVGISHNIGACCQSNSALSLGATYGNRPARHLEFEVGVITAWNPAPDIYGRNFSVQPDDLFIWVPFGVRGILPLRSDRVELSAGGGGVYEKYSVRDGSAIYRSRSGGGAYLTLGVAVALSERKEWWLTAAPRFFIVNPRGYNDRRLAVVGGIARWF
jgi:hypothetical protein